MWSVMSSAAVLLLGPHVDQLVASFCEGCQGVAGRFGRRIGNRPHRPCEDGEHAGVDRIGFCQPHAGAGEVAGTGRIDTGKPYSGLAQHFSQRTVIDAGGLEHDEHIVSAPPTRHLLCDGLWRVGDALGLADGIIKNIEHGFGDVDSDAAKGYDHGACPCDARSVAAASCNCSG